MSGIGTRLGMAAGLAGLLLVAACGSGGTAEAPATGGSAAASAPAEKVELTYWHFIDQTKMVEKWNQTHPNVQVTYESLPSDTYFTKLQAAVKAGTAPDVALVEYQMMNTMVAADALEDISAHVPADLGGKFPAWSWQQSTQGEKVYGIPQDIAPMGMYYRADVFDKHGIEVPKTWEEYAAAAEKLSKADPEVKMAIFSPQQAGQWAGLTWQNGAKWYTAESDAWKVTLNDDKSKQVAAVWQRMLDTKAVAGGADFSPEWVKGLTDGTIATWIAPSWAQSYIKGSMKKAEGKFKVAPMPQWADGRTAAGNWGGSALSVPKGSKHAAQAAEFITWLNTDPDAVNLAVDTNGIFPALVSGQSSPAFTKEDPFFGGQKTQEVFLAAQQGVDPDFTWGPNMTTVFAMFKDEFGKAVNGQGTLSDALDRVQARAVEDMRKQGFPVAE
ncbi:ABC transporter substrate-binding protein [Planomonospora venezuelensis]|uniref:Multiple sugar transport system substrate-binding protein n=1 Tax=Planomonospora venezuelensis TaxID=1999 RepID=A0A841D604_PLAVE|nr:extracellular solute-binding protein [Planomonospora venezuelensis]MBB5963575.1 multiple sugar transport system substrate-binding protein [Planomonospora venezuelensis]GIN02094.1 sugar ABC transporter substrate-binding protein [Planomonospora venezuelensis]